MTYYIKSGNQFDVTSEANLDIHHQLPVGTYTIQQRPPMQGGGLYFQMVDDLENKGKVYGDHKKNAIRIINTYKERPRNTGVLLTGEKGSGKTLLARMIAEDCAKLNMPTIIITKPWTGDSFEMLINGLEQDCVILFDEFEKTYDKEHQEKMLTLLDGLSSSKKLFIFTCNDKWRLDQHMHNRPGRIFYMIEYKGLSEDFIREYCIDNLNNKTHIEKIVRLSGMFQNFNFDMLKALIEEMNRYDETPEEALSILNAKPESGKSGNAVYDVVIKDKRFEKIAYLHDDEEDRQWSGDIFNCSARILYFPTERMKLIYEGDVEPENDAERSEVKWYSAQADRNYLVGFNKEGEYVFKIDEDVTMILTKVKTQVKNFYDFCAF